MLFLTLCLVLSFSLAFGQIRKPPAIRTLLTTEGIDALKLIANSYMRAERSTIEALAENFSVTYALPALLHGSVHLEVTIDRLQLIDFDIPSLHHALVAPRSVELRTDNGHAKLNGDWSVRNLAKGLPRTRGHFSVDASNFVTTASLRLGRNLTTGNAIAVFESCTADVTDVVVELTGGPVGIALQAASDQIEDKFRDLYSDRMCPLLREYIDSVTRTLGELPMTFDYSSLQLNYKLTADPVVSTENRWIETLHKGEISAFGFGGIPFAPEPLPEIRLREPRMGQYVWLSDYVINSALHTVHEYGYAKYEVDEESQPQLANILNKMNCTASSAASSTVQRLCLGRLLPDVPANATASIKVESTQAPFVNVSEDRIRLSADVMVDVAAKVSPSVKSPVLGAQIAVDIDVVPRIINGTKLVGNASIHRLDVIVKSVSGSTTVAAETRSAIDGFVREKGKPLIELLLNERLRDGFDVGFGRPLLKPEFEFVLENRAVRLGGRFSV